MEVDARQVVKLAATQNKPKRNVVVTIKSPFEAARLAPNWRSAGSAGAARARLLCKSPIGRASELMGRPSGRKLRQADWKCPNWTSHLT